MQFIVIHIINVNLIDNNMFLTNDLRIEGSQSLMSFNLRIIDRMRNY